MGFPSNGTLFGTPTAASPITTYTVTVSDSVGQTASATFTLVVDNLSKLVATQAVPSTVVNVNTNITKFLPIVGFGGVLPLTYSVAPSLPAGLSFNSAGEVTGQPRSVSANTTYTVTITDAAGQTDTNTFSLQVTGVALVANPALVTKTLVRSVAYTPFAPVTATGGVGTYTYTISPGLPTAMQISASTGLISSTATQISPTTVYTVTITDTAAQTTSSRFILNVDPLPALTATTVISLPTLTQNAASSPFIPVTATGGYGLLVYSIQPALPAGVVLNTQTGFISGTPTVSQSTTTYNLVVTDSALQVSSSTFQLRINPIPLAVSTSQSLVIMTKLAPAAAVKPVAATGGVIPLAYTVSPNLPNGLVISSSTGVISGTPTVGLNTSTFAVTVTDSALQTGSANFNLQINDLPAITATTLVATTSLVINSTVAYTPA